MKRRRSTNDENDIYLENRDNIVHNQPGIQTHNGPTYHGSVTNNYHAPCGVSSSDRHAVAVESLDQSQRWLDSLDFTQLESRHATIEAAYAKTCQWLLKTPQYLNWLNDGKLSNHHGFLWIKGNPGTGKSTASKFAFTQMKKASTGCITIAFFFNARGEELEKSTAGLYRSLILQILKKLPALTSTLSSVQLVPNEERAIHWDVPALRTAFRNVVDGLGPHRVVCFIDALDECQDVDIRDMVDFFEELGASAAVSSNPFRTCFSSRHYPHITIDHGLSLVLEDEEGHRQDLATYVQNKLKIGSSKLALQIKEEILDRACGIFLWVCLVVRILREDFEKGNIHKVKQHLKEIPDSLEQIYNEILTRDGEPDQGLVLCLQWVLYAHRPLAADELYCAVLTGLEPDAVLMDKWDKDQISGDVLTRFILSRSNGLVEENKAKPRKVQFIHETVREFLLGGKGLSHQCFGSPQTFEARSHDKLKQCCQAYYARFVESDLHPRFGTRAMTFDSCEIRQRVCDDYPFLEYAVHNVLYHCDKAQKCGCSQDDFVQGLDLPRWVQVSNFLQPYAMRRYSPRVSLPYVAAEMGLPCVIEVAVKQKTLLALERERRKSAFIAAVVSGSKAATRVLLHAYTAMACAKPSSCITALSEEDKEEALTALAQIEKPALCESPYSLIRRAAEHGDIGLIKCLIWIYDGKINERLKKNALLAASYHAQTDVVSLMLAMGVSAFGQLPRSFCGYRTAIDVACARGHRRIVAMLLDAGPTALLSEPGCLHLLVQASRNGDKAMVSELLASQIWGPSTSEYLRTALYEASRLGNEDVVETLLQAISCGYTDHDRMLRHALIGVSLAGHEKIMSMILIAGTNVDFNTAYREILTGASRTGFARGLKTLVAAGAKIGPTEQPHFYLEVTLLRACLLGHTEVVAIVLEVGADAGIVYQSLVTLKALSRVERCEEITSLLTRAATAQQQTGARSGSLEQAVHSFHDCIRSRLECESLRDLLYGYTKAKRVP